MKNKSRILYESILTILAILVGYVLYCSVFKIYNPLENLQPIIIILGVIISICFFISINKFLEKIHESKYRLIAIALCIIFFVGLVIVGSNLIYIPQYDLKHLQKEAIVMLENDGKIVSPYFQRYINQCPATILIYFIYKIGSLLSINNLRIAGIIVNSIFITTTAIFTYLIIEKVKNKKSALTSLIFFIINPVFYIYSAYFYTDTLCMPFAAIGMYLFILGIKEQKTNLKIIKFIFSGLLFAIGFKIRVVVGIFLIASVIGLWNSKEIKKWITANGTVIAGFIIGILVCNLVTNQFLTEKDKNLEFPAVHWIMIGLNQGSDGKYTDDDFDYTNNSGNYSEKVNADINKIKDRIKDLRTKNLIELAKVKLACNWSNGEYSYIEFSKNVQNITNIYNYVSGNRKIFLLYYSQICKVTILLTFMIAICSNILKKEKENLEYKTIYISIFGAFLFYIIWEVKSRYSLTFLPWLILLFPIGIEEIEKIVSIQKVKRGNYIALISLVLSVFLLIINFYPYTIKKETYCDIRACQTTNNNAGKTKISNQKIGQTFYCSKPFNQIGVKFINRNTKEETNYNFVLKDEFGKELVRQNFTSKSVENNEFKIFKFMRIKPSEEKKYIIEIYSDDATDENSLEVSMFYQEEYDSYLKGSAIVNGKKKNADFTFQVQDERKRTYISKKTYILGSFAIIMVEIVAIYPYINYNRNKKR